MWTAVLMGTAVPMIIGALLLGLRMGAAGTGKSGSEYTGL